MSEPGPRVAHAVGPTALPPVAPLAPTAHDPLARAWINHENLAELTFGWIEYHLGAAGLNAFTSLLGLLVLGLMVRNAAREGVSFLVLSVAILLATCAIGPGWSIRPQVFTYTFFALLLVILGRAFRPGARPDARALWLAPPLFALWANTHGGFPAGLAVLALYLGCRALAALWSAGRGGWREVGRYALVLAACGLATLANPYGPRLLAWLIADLAPPRPEIGEWYPLALPDPLFVVTVALVGLTVAAFIGSRRPTSGRSRCSRSPRGSPSSTRATRRSSASSRASGCRFIWRVSGAASRRPHPHARARRRRRPARSGCCSARRGRWRSSCS